MDSRILITFVVVTVLLILAISTAAIYLYRKSNKNKNVKQNRTNKMQKTITTEAYYIGYILFILGVFIALVFIPKLDIYLQNTAAMIFFIIPMYLIAKIKKFTEEKLPKVSVIFGYMLSISTGISFMAIFFILDNIH